MRRLSYSVFLALWFATVGLGTAALMSLGWLWGMVALVVVGGSATFVLTRPVQLLQRLSKAIAEGDLNARFPRSRASEFDAAGVSLNRVTEELALMSQSARRERDEMRTLLDSMTEGVLELTEDARLVRANRAAQSILEVRDFPSFAPIGSLIRHPALREALERAAIEPFDGLELALRERTVVVASKHLEQGGAIVTVQDLTEVRRLEKVRSDFVANASHELKTPLTALRGIVESLLDGDPPEPIRRAFLQSIKNNSLRLQRLIEDLLDLSRLESGGWRADLMEVDVRTVAELAWEEADGAQDRALRFRINGDAVVKADEHGFEQVLRNLFDNSIRHTPDGGKVTVEIVPESSSVRIDVVDTGSGIPSEALPRIFERFYRVDPARSREEGGTGLGLAIVSHIMNQMGGSVSADSRLGEGTRIRLMLPSGSEHTE